MRSTVDEIGTAIRAQLGLFIAAAVVLARWAAVKCLGSHLGQKFPLFIKLRSRVSLSTLVVTKLSGGARITHACSVELRRGLRLGQKAKARPLDPVG